MNEQIKKLFKNPTNDYRGKPFWSWNGKLEKDELMRQIDVINDMGFGGYFMHSRTGLETEYLGQQWFDLTNECVKYGKEKNLESWLYDEDRWPSGTAGGQVTKNPDYRMSFIEMTTADTFIYDANSFIQFACILNGTNYTNERILTENNSLNSGETAITFKRVEAPCNSNYNSTTYVDVMNRQAIDEYIKVTHEQYKQKCSETFSDIKGIFTDEPHRGPLFSNFSMGSNARVPFTWKLFDEFKSRFGYDLKTNLLELFLHKNGEKISKVKWNYVELLQELFIENFAKPINEWCNDNGFILTGHYLHEDSYTCQTAMCGSIMRMYEDMGYPGIDTLAEGNENYWIVKQIASVARQLDKKWVLSELYGCTGWQMNFESYKNVGDWQALFGVNVRCPHLSWYTMKGESKRDYPASIFHQSPWYNDYKFIEDYFSRLNVILSSGEVKCDVLVINGIESQWARVYSGCFDGLSTIDEDMMRLEDIYAKTFHYLQGNKIDFDYGDEEMLSRHAKISGSDFIVGNSKYKKILVTGLDTIRSTTLDLIEKFIEMGGEVVFAGEAPQYVDAQRSSRVNMVAKTATIVPFEEKALADACSSDGNVKIIGENIASIFVQIRNNVGGEKAIVLLNVDRKNGHGNVKFNLGKGASAYILNAKTGEKELASYQIIDGDVIVNWEVFAGEEAIFIIKASESESTIIDEKISSTLINLSQEFEYSLSEENICVLDRASYSVNNGEWKEENEILKVDRGIRDELGIEYRGGEMLQPWYVKKTQGEGKINILADVTLKFDFFVDEMPNHDMVLVVEQYKEIEVKLNGNVIDTSMPIGKWIDICFDKFLLPSKFLVNGKNTIEISTAYHTNNDLEAIYLLGEFGVKLDDCDKHIVALPNKLKIGDISTQNLPFYSGKIVYSVKVAEIIGKKAVIHVNEFEGACVKIRTNEGEKFIAWQPRKVDITDIVKHSDQIQLEVVLTRRNTFGPLHQYPLLSASYGPGNFVTDGEYYKDEYVLLEQGLLGKVTIEII